MTGRTHLTLGVAAGLAVAVQTGANPAVLALIGGIGGLLPDIDHPHAMLSGFLPGANFLLRLGRVRHRGFTHSVLFVVLLVAAWVAASQQIAIPYPFAYAFWGGVASHLISDMLTPSGIQLLFPLKTNFKLAPGAILRLGKWAGLLEALVWAGGTAAAGWCVWVLIMK